MSMRIFGIVFLTMAKRFASSVAMSASDATLRVISSENEDVSSSDELYDSTSTSDHDSSSSEEETINVQETGGSQT